MFLFINFLLFNSRILTGVVDYLNTEISTSKQKKFSLVTFVDTPGLVDGDMKYPFDVNESIEWLGKLCIYDSFSTLTNLLFHFIFLSRRTSRFDICFL